MDSFLPQGFEPGPARPGRRAHRAQPQLHVQAGPIRFPLLRTWATGFAVDATRVPMLSGVIEVFDGAERVCEGLITGAQTQGGERIFEIKRANPVNHAAFADHDALPGFPRR